MTRSLITPTERQTITISNLAGGDSRRFWGVSDAAIRHARRIMEETGMDIVCSDGDAYDEIQQALADQQEED